ncbi:hypothetical protein M7I_3543 [Glarea lozoyensis 74030]|uniref:Uncharacterized protein n=1 Tax=Glarea lozoyensis (strain ATCC 74030 / MF5533) TaxID=1104152 RepID=H0ELS3_GLAL7|nr:hypothetical protein M7I_3543 [Glarea lozoyensis 74030]
MKVPRYFCPWCGVEFLALLDPLLNRWQAALKHGCEVGVADHTVYDHCVVCKKNPKDWSSSEQRLCFDLESIEKSVDGIDTILSEYETQELDHGLKSRHGLRGDWDRSPVLGKSL